MDEKTYGLSQDEETKHLRKTPKRLIFNPSVTVHRSELSRAIPSFEAEDVPFVDMLVPIEPSVQIPVRIYTFVESRLKENEKIPTIFYIPQTGFIAAEIPFTHATCTYICKNVKCRIIVVHHRLAPESQFPVSYRDAYKVLEFFVKKFSNFYAIDINQIAIAGYSSGANIAALMTIEAIKENIPIKKQILISPIVDFSRTLPGFEKFEEKDTDITAEFVYWVIGLYLPENVSLMHPKASPFWADNKDIKGLPSTDFIFAEYDRCRSDSEHYAAKLRGAEVPVEKFIMKNETHAFLWRNKEVTRKFAERIDYAFHRLSLGRPLSNTISHLRIRHNPANDQNNSIFEEEVYLKKAKL